MLFRSVDRPETARRTVCPRTAPDDFVPEVRGAEQGDGPLVVLCHGFPETWYSWRHQLPALAGAGYRAVAVDMRGYGETDQPEGIGSFLLRLAFAEFRRRGHERVLLNVDSENETGAVGVYERAGMHVRRQWDLYQKVIQSPAGS